MLIIIINFQGLQDIYIKNNSRGRISLYRYKNSSTGDIMFSSNSNKNGPVSGYNNLGRIGFLVYNLLPQEGYRFNEY